MEVSALRYSGGIGLHARSPLLRLQSDERLIVLIRRGNASAFEMLVSRYQSRLLAFCRHLLGSREDAEDVLQEVFTAAYNAMVADDRAINVRPWLYRIARNRCLNHLRRVQAVGVDSMDIHLSDHGETTADKVHMAEEFRLLVGDIQGLPETQRTALVLREMDALSYEQIAEAMETTVSSVKSLLVRARLSLAEAAEARMLSCDSVRMELAEVAEGLLPKPSAPVRRHLRTCQRCSTFQSELKRTSRVLAALLPLGPVALLKSLALAHLGHSAGAAGGAASGSGAAGGAAVGTGAAASGAAAGGALITAGSGSIVPLGLGAIATKTAAGLAAAALVTAGAVEVSPSTTAHHHRPTVPAPVVSPSDTHAAVAEVAQAPAFVARAAVATVAAPHPSAPHPSIPVHARHRLHGSTTHRHPASENPAKATTVATTVATKKDSLAKDAAATTAMTTTTAKTNPKSMTTPAAAPPSSDGVRPQPTTSSQPGAATASSNQLTPPSPSPSPSPSPASGSRDPNSGGSTTTASSGDGTSTTPAGGSQPSSAGDSSSTSTNPTITIVPPGDPGLAVTEPGSSTGP